LRIFFPLSFSFFFFDLFFPFPPLRFARALETMEALRIFRDAEAKGLKMIYSLSPPPLFPSSPFFPSLLSLCQTDRGGGRRTRSVLSPLFFLFLFLALPFLPPPPSAQDETVRDMRRYSGALHTPPPPPFLFFCCPSGAVTRHSRPIATVDKGFC